METRKMFQGLFLINFFISLGFGINDAFFPLFCQSIGAHGLLLGAAVGGYALSKILFSPLMGNMADRFGRRPLVFTSLLLYLLVSCAYLVAENVWIVVCLRLLQGASCAMFRPVLQTLIADHASVDHRGKVMGSFDVSFYAALCVGPVIGGMIMDTGGFQSLFSVLILCSLAALGLAISTIPRPLTTKFGLVHESKQPGSRFLGWRCGTLKGLLIFIFGRACGITACATFLPILLSSKLDLNGMRVGMVMAAASLAMTVLLRPFGKLADKASCRLLVICGGTVVPLLYMLLPFVVTFSQALAVTLSIGVFSALSQPAASALLAEEGHRNGMGASIGTFHAYLNLGFVAGPLLGSLVQTATDLHGVFIGIGVVGLCSVLGFAVTTSQTTSLILAKKGKAYLSS